MGKRWREFKIYIVSFAGIGRFPVFYVWNKNGTAHKGNKNITKLMLYISPESQQFPTSDKCLVIDQ